MHPCLVDGCTTAAKYDTCGPHRATCAQRPSRVLRGGSTTDYQRIHNRLRRVRGPAKLLTCENCGKPAQEWSYDHRDPDERIGENARGRRVTYSINLGHYRPLCVPCHRIVDDWKPFDSRTHLTSTATRGAPPAPAVEFEPGVVEPLPWHSTSAIDLRKPPERTGHPRRCSRCRMVKDEGAFRWRSREQKYRASRCRLCDKYLSRERSRGRVGMLSRPRPYDPAVNHALRAKHRARAIAIYGGRCVWCGSTDDLEFDHPNNDGKAHRAAEGVDMMVSRISRTGRPLEDWTVQLLCRPCHRGRRWPKRRAAGRPA
jgi:hypothetical protein